MHRTRIESIVHYGQNHGWISSIILCFNLVLLKLGIQKKIAAYPYPKVSIRNRTSDLPVFRQIFINEEYKINIGFIPQIIVDLGANVGYSSIFFAHSFPNSRIFAVEPDPSNFQQLQTNVQRYKNIKPMNYAIWSESTFLNLEQNVALGEWGVQVKKGNTLNASIQAKSIIDLMNDESINFIDLLKIDIETAEEELFRSSDWLEKIRVLVIETHDRIKPGSSNNFIKAIGNLKKFNIEISGENIIVWNNSK